MNTHVPGLQSFLVFLHHFVLAKLATSSIMLIRLSCIYSSNGTCICLSFISRYLWPRNGLQVRL